LEQTGNRLSPYVVTGDVMAAISEGRYHRA
jgi:hypothetical protein